MILERMIEMSKFYYASVLLGGAMFLSLVQHPAAAAPALTEAKAKQLADAFCRSIGQPVASLPMSQTATSKSGEDTVTTKFTDTDSVHWQKRWMISVPNMVRVHVSDETGNISDYMNDAYFHRFDHTPASKAISEAEAIQRATLVIKAEGAALSEMVLIEAREQQEGADAQGHEWILRWRRTYQGIPYRNQYALVDLQAETGEIIDAGVGLDLLPPPSLEENISRTQAMSIGQAQLAAAGITGGALAWEHKMIIQPDTFWQNGNQRPFSNATRTAWVCGFDSGGTTYGVWVDTQTGDVIGGMIGGVLGRPAKRQTPIFGHQLKHLKQHVR